MGEEGSTFAKLITIMIRSTRITIHFYWIIELFPKQFVRCNKINKILEQQIYAGSTFKCPTNCYKI